MRATSPSSNAPLDEPPLVRLGEVVRITHGWPFKSERFSEELTGRPIVVSIGNFRYTGGFRFESTTVKEYRDEYPKEYDLAPGDVLLVMTCQTPGGEILGIPGRIPNDGRRYLHNQRMGKVVLTRPDLADIDYLYWLFCSKAFNQSLVASASGTKILHTAPSRIESYSLRLPPLREQRAIARILSSLDDKIELNRRTNETLDAIARTLFRSLFVDFGQARAETGGRSASGISSEMATHQQGALVDSALGPIPTGWRAEPIDSVATFLNGLALQKFPADGPAFLPVIKIAELRRGDTIGSDRASPRVPANYVVADGDVLFSWSGSLTVTIWCGGPGALNQHLFKVTSERFPRWLIHRWLLQHLPEFQAIAADKATTMGHIQRGHLTKALVAVPPPDFIQRVAPIFEGLEARWIANNLQSRTLRALRDGLLPRLMSGELKVSRAERDI